MHEALSLWIYARYTQDRTNWSYHLLIVYVARQQVKELLNRVLTHRPLLVLRLGHGYHGRSGLIELNWFGFRLFRLNVYSRQH